MCKGLVEPTKSFEVIQRHAQSVYTKNMTSSVPLPLFASQPIRVPRRMLAFCVLSILLHGILLRSVTWTQGPAISHTTPEQVIHVNTLTEGKDTIGAEPSPESSGKIDSTITTSPTAPADRNPAAAARTNSSRTTKPTPIADNQEQGVSDQPETYAVRLPPSATINMNIQRIVRFREPVSGELAMQWDVNNGEYKIAMDAHLNPGNGPENLYTYQSEGIINQYGIAPLNTSITRLSRAETAIHVDPIHKTVSFSSSNKTDKWANGGQDRASLFMQLAGIGIANPKLFEAGNKIKLQVAEDNSTSLFEFIVVGQEDIATELGNLRSWHLRRVLPENSPLALLEIWLTPEHYWYPTQIRSTETQGTVTTQTLRSIQVKPE